MQARLSKLKDEIADAHQKNQLHLFFPDPTLRSILEQFLDDLSNAGEDADIHRLICDMAAFIMSHSPELDIQESALDIIALSRDSKFGQKTASLQLNIMLKTLALMTSKLLSNSPMSTSLLLFFLDFAFSPLEPVQDAFLSVLVDPKHYSQVSLLHLPNEYQLNPLFLIQLVQIFSRMIQNGPLSDKSANTVLTYADPYDMIQKFFNQFVYGKLGMKNPEITTPLKKVILSSLLSFLTISDNSDNAAYFSELHHLSGKFYIKFSQQFDSQQLLKQLSDSPQEQETQDHYACYQLTLDALQAIQSTKLLSPAKKAFRLLTDALTDTAA